MSMFDKPFADKGDKSVISLDDLGIDGRVSWERGFTSKYEKKPEQDGYYIIRQDYNSIFHMITKELLDLRSKLVPLGFDAGKLASTGYNNGETIIVYYNPLTGVIAGDLGGFNEEERLFATRLEVISQKDANKDSPLIRANYHKSWYINDGNHFGQIVDFGVNEFESSFSPPPGYFDIGNPKDANQQFIKYNIDDYPRVKYLLGKKDKHGLALFIKDSNDDSKFYIQDIRGCFARLYANAHPTRDKGRAFDNIQNDGMKKLYSEITICSYSDYTEKAEGDDKYHNLSCFMLKKTPGTPSLAKIERRSSTMASSRSGSSSWSHGVYGSSIDRNEIRNAFGNRLILDTSEVTGDCDEFRPHNFNVKKYIKL